MNLTINQYPINYINFERRLVLTETQKTALSNIPTRIRNGESVQQISDSIGLSKAVVYDWLKYNCKYSIKELKQEFYDNKCKPLLTKYFHEHKDIKEIAQIIGKSTHWVRSCIFYYGLNANRSSAIETVKTNVPNLIEQGASIKQMSERLNVSSGKIAAYIKQNYSKEFILNNYPELISKRQIANDKKNILAKTVIKYIEAEKSITEIAKLTGETKIKIIRILKDLNMKTKFQTNKERLPKEIPVMIANKMTETQMAKELGVSTATIKRYILKHYGASYSAIKKDIL